MKKLIKNTLCITTAATLALAPTSALAMSQEETVYAKLQPSGSLDYLSVSKHLLNDLRDTKLNDKSILRNIENVNGFEEYNANGENLIWNANGKDIYYSGKTDKELPVQVAVTYQLNGEEKSLEDMLGKSGKVEIRFKYRNFSKVGSLYTPFVVAFGTTLPESSTHNVSITNGKIISNGRDLIVTAIAAPGLYDSLKIDEVKNLDVITLSYETDKFELNDTYNIVTPKVLDSDDLKIFDEVDKLTTDTQKLSSSSKELANGTNKLKSGIQELRDTLVSARSQLNSLSSLLDTKTLNSIANTAARTARQKVSEQRQDIYNTIDQQVAGMMPDSSLMQQLNALKPIMIEQQKIAKCKELTTSSKQSLDENDGTILSSCDTDANAILNTIGQQQGIDINGQIVVAVNTQFSSIANKLDQKTITDKLFDSTYGAIQNVAEETAANTARSVATQLVGSIQKDLNEKLNSLMDKLIGGVDQLLDGANELNNGMQQFDREGIQKLNNVVSGKIKNTSDKVKQLTKLADQYNNFSGIADGAEGTTKFILMIEGKKQK